jgi:hypothetical protein
MELSAMLRLLPSAPLRRLAAEEHRLCFGAAAGRGAASLRRKEENKQLAEL